MIYVSLEDLDIIELCVPKEKSLIFNDIPTKRGIYMLYEDCELLYIGKANDLRSRLQNHFADSPNWKRDVDKIRYFCVYDPASLDAYETLLINSENPKYNKSKKFNRDYKEKVFDYQINPITAKRIDEGINLLEYMDLKSNYTELKAKCKICEDKYSFCEAWKAEKKELKAERNFWLYKYNLLMLEKESGVPV